MSLGRLLTGSTETGEDLAQEVLLDVLKRLRANPGFLYEPAYPYLRKALVRTAAKKRRRMMGELARLARLWPLREGDDIERAGTAYEALSSLTELPPRMRACAVLAFVEDQSYADIAAAMGIGVRTVEEQLRRARARLGDRLAALEQDTFDAPAPRSARR
jgi:RNA polymerase sigma factor (sigma-70 family)